MSGYGIVRRGGEKGSPDNKEGSHPGMNLVGSRERGRFGSASGNSRIMEQRPDRTRQEKIVTIGRKDRGARDRCRDLIEVANKTGLFGSFNRAIQANPRRYYNAAFSVLLKHVSQSEATGFVGGLSSQEMQELVLELVLNASISIILTLNDSVPKDEDQTRSSFAKWFEMAVDELKRRYRGSRVVDRVHRDINQYPWHWASARRELENHVLKRFGNKPIIDCLLDLPQIFESYSFSQGELTHREELAELAIRTYLRVLSEQILIELRFILRALKTGSTSSRSFHHVDLMVRNLVQRTTGSNGDQTLVQGQRPSTGGEICDGAGEAVRALPAD